MSEWYQGMTIVYRKGTELDEKLVAIVKILLKMGFKWIMWEYKEEGFTAEWNGRNYVVKEYGAKEIDRLEYNSGAEWLADVKPKNIKSIEDTELSFLIKTNYEKKKNIYLYIVPFPPEEYYCKYGAKYQGKNPFHPASLVTCEEGNRVEIYKYKKEKEVIIIDFRSLHRYFKFSEPPLSVAVENFVLDLMRDIAKETKPEYAYMDLNEYRPLENDPVCENMKELVRYNSKFGKGMYVEAGQIFYVRKDIIEKECGKDLSEVYHPYYEDRYRVFIEELDGHYLMHGEDFVYTKNYPIYKCLNREQEYEILSKIPEEIVIKGVCGDIENGLRLKVSGYRGDEKESDIVEKIEKWSKKYGVKIIDIKIQ